MEEDFIIPIDGAIEEFLHHLDSHDRTILSARFGDGKSFFLSHFMEDEDVAEHYTFLTIFPVNYQVAENTDVFELVKRDILLQMFMKGIIQIDDELKNLDALALYVQNEPLSFLNGFVPLLSTFEIPEDYAKIAVAAKVCKSIYGKIKERVNEYKKQNKNRIVESFFDEIERNPIVGTDAISRLIYEGIENYKKRNAGKEVVLVIEDLDRIDPAHLFRILNIFSAHIDFCYRLGCKPNKTLSGNKFGLDKVVFVMDYRNAQYIYSHFYGEGTNFDGYIEKFCSSNYFSFSLEEQRDNYFFRQIEKETGLNSNLLNYFLMPSDFKNISVRKVVHAIEHTENSVLSIFTGLNFAGKAVPLHTGMLKLISILRKLAIPDAEIINRLKRVIEKRDISNTGLFMYLAPYLNLAAYKNARGGMCFTKSVNMVNTFYVDAILDDGRASCRFVTSLNYDDDVDIRLLDLLRNVLQMVAK